MLDELRTLERAKFPPWVTPVFGGLAGLSLVRYTNLFGGDETAMRIAMMVVLGTAGGKILSFMDAADSSDDGGATPNPTLTVILLVASVLLFWVPFAGLALISYAIYRSRWLIIANWLGLAICCLFFVSVAVSLVWAIIVAMEGGPSAWVKDAVT